MLTLLAVQAERDCVLAERQACRTVAGSVIRSGPAIVQASSCPLLLN